MARLTNWMVLVRTALASIVALSVIVPTKAGAQTEAAQAYLLASQLGTIRALEEFIEKYPLSLEANDAFRDIVTLSRGSTLANSGPTGLFSSTSIVSPQLSRGISPY